MFFYSEKKKPQQPIITKDEMLKYSITGLLVIVILYIFYKKLFKSNKKATDKRNIQKTQQQELSPSPSPSISQHVEIKQTTPTSTTTPINSSVSISDFSDALHQILEDEIATLKKERRFHLITETVDAFNNELFKYSNQGRDKYEIDLHGLHVTHSISYLNKRINQLYSEGYTGKLRVITGQGNHSLNGKAKIKPKVIEYLRDNDINFESTSGGGALLVSLE